MSAAVEGFALVYSGQVPLNFGERLIAAWRVYKQVLAELRAAYRDGCASILQIARRIGMPWREVWNRIVVGVVPNREFWSRAGDKVPLADMAAMVFVMGREVCFRLESRSDRERRVHLERALGLAPYRIDFDLEAGGRFACYAGGRRVRL